MTPSLSFEQAPPISVPYRFFLTAPLYGVAAGLVLATGAAGGALASSWTPGAFAVTHLIVAGFMLQAMCGALLQFVAVVAGANIWRPRLVAWVVHPSITAGAALLVAAFLLGRPALFAPAAILLAAALAVFVAVLAVALLRTSAQGPTIHVLRASVLGLVATVAFGATLAFVLGLGWSLPASWPLPTLIQVHFAWGLGGWALMLVIGVSYLVVPMFQMTPAYPAWFARALPVALLAALVLWSLLSLAGPAAATPWPVLVAAAGILAAASYAGVTLRLQARRRRRQTDATFALWRVAMLSLLGFAVSWLAFEAAPGLGAHPGAPVWLGVLALAGVFVSLIAGMLYKIVPFLNWLHLQREAGPGVALPNMKQMIPEPSMRGQARLQFAAVALLLAAVAWPALAAPAGIALAASCLWLEGNLIAGVRRYARTRASLRARGRGARPG